MIDTIASSVLGLPPWVALVVVFALPALESSAFVGFVFPGEVALILGGVLAEQGRLPLAGVLLAGFVGAVVGDSVGYAVGRRYGRPILDGTLGKLVRRDHVDRAERYLAQRGGRAVFLGRFTATLRVMVPGMAGMAGLRYPVFLAYNVAGAAGWVTLSVLLGYLGGSSWRHVEHVASRIGLGVLGVVVLVAVAAAALHRIRGRGLLDRLGRHPLALAVRRRFPRSTRWLLDRLDPARSDGLPATVAGLVLAGATGTFLGVTQDVAAREEVVRIDPWIHSWMLTHHTPLLDVFFRLVTYLGSEAVLIPVLVTVTAVLAWRRRSRLPIVAGILVYGGAVLLHALVALSMQRPRPPQGDWIAPASGWSYPSGHTARAWAAFGLLVLLVWLYSGRRAWLPALATATTGAVLVGVSRVYLGVSWTTDVLGAATMSVALISACTLLWLVFLSSAPQERDLPLPRAQGLGR